MSRHHHERHKADYEEAKKFRNARRVNALFARLEKHDPLFRLTRVDSAPHSRHRAPMTTPPPPPSSPMPDGFEIFWATPEVAVGAMPCKPEHLEHLKAQGVGAVLNLCAEFCDLPDIERDHGLAVRFLPIDDMGVPEPDPLDEALDWLDAQLSFGLKVFVHCRFGMGRTGTVLACWLARRGVCPNHGPRWRAAPVSNEQHRFVADYLQRHGLAPEHPALWDRLLACLFGR